MTARARYSANGPEITAPPLDEVEDDGRIAIFDPERCDEEAHWIQIDVEHAVCPMEER